MRQQLFVVAALAAAAYHAVDGSYAWVAALVGCIAVALVVMLRTGRPRATVSRRLSVGPAVAPGSVAPRRG